MAKITGTRVSNLVQGQNVILEGSEVTIQGVRQVNKREYNVRYYTVKGSEFNVNLDCNTKVENCDDDAYLSLCREIHKMTKGILHN